MATQTTAACRKWLYIQMGACVKKLNIIIPAAGEGKRFQEQGYNKPKPMIDVDGLPMIQRVIDNLRPIIPHKYILIQQRKHEIPSSVFGGSEAHRVYLDEPTAGAVDTILKGAGSVQDGEAVLLANCDQLAVTSVDEFIRSDRARIITFTSNNPHHSYVTKVGDRVSAIAEKEVISQEAVFGWYYFPDGKQFIDYCKKVVENDERVNNEHYVSSAIKLMVKDNIILTTYMIPSDAKFILGTPEELEQYLSHFDRSKKSGI